MSRKSRPLKVWTRRLAWVVWRIAKRNKQRRNSIDILNGF